MTYTIESDFRIAKTVLFEQSGLVRGTYLALDHMKKQNGGKGGVIINIASLAGSKIHLNYQNNIIIKCITPERFRFNVCVSGLGPLPSAPIYTATKHGVVGFTRALAVRTPHQGPYSGGQVI